LIFHYIRHFYNTGYVYEEVGLYDDAKREYERVLDIDPVFADALVSLSRLYGEKFENKDYLKAIEYLQKYLALLAPDQKEAIEEVYKKADEYDQKYKEMLKNEQEEYERQEQEEATESGESQ